MFSSFNHSYKKAITIVLGFCIATNVSSQNIGEAFFSDSTLFDLVGTPLIEIRNKFSLADSLSDSVKHLFLPYLIKEEIIPKKEIVAFNSMKVENLFLCLNEKRQVSAYIFLFSNHFEHLFDSLVSRIDSPKTSFYLNTDKAFNIPYKSISYFWTFNGDVIKFETCFFQNKDILVISVHDVNEYMKTY